MAGFHYAERHSAKRRAAAERPREFPNARRGIVDNKRGRGREAYRGDAFGQPQWRSFAYGREADGGTGNYAATDGRRFGEDDASARDGGNRSGTGRIFVRDPDYRA